MALGDSRGYSDLSGPGSSTALWHQHFHRWQYSSWDSLWPLEATWVIDINTDSGCSRNMNPDMVFGNTPRPDVIMALVGIADCPYWHGSSGGMALENHHVSRWLSRLQTSSWPSTTTRATNINTYLGCSRATDPGMALGSSSGPKDTLALGSSLGLPDLYGLSSSLTLKDQHGLR